MARRDVGKIQQPRFTPQAAPVSTYHRTAEGDTLRQLADSLAGFAPQVAAFATTLHEKKKKEDFERGQFETNKGIAENIEEVRKQIAEGTLGASESKWYRLGATEAFGKAFGRKYASDWAHFVATDPVLSKTTDMNVYDEEERKFRKEWYADPTRGPGTAESNLAIEKGFQPAADNAVAGQRFNFAQAAGSRLEGAVNELHYQEVQQIYDMALPDATPQEIGRAIGYLVRTQYILNPKAGQLINQTTIKSVVDLAILHGDPEILDILMEIPGGPKGSRLGKTSQAREAVEKAKDKIAQNFMRDNSVSNARESKREEMIGQTAYANLHDRMADALADGGQAGLENYDIQKDIDELVAAGGTPQQEATLMRVFEASKDRVTADDPDTRQALFLAAFQGRLSAERIAQDFGSRQITAETGAALRRMLDDQNGAGELRSAAANVELRRAVSDVQKGIVDSYGGVDSELTAFKDREARIRMTNAFFAWSQTEEGKKALTLDDGGIALDAFLVQQGDMALKALAKDYEETVGALGKSKAPRTPTFSGGGAEDEGWMQKRTVLEPVLADMETLVTKMREDKSTVVPPEIAKVLFSQEPPVEPNANAIRRFINKQREFK